MNFYITYGTLGFLKQIQEKHEDRELHIFSGEGQSVIFEESQTDTVFQQPNEYRALTRVGTIQDSDFQVLITIPTTEDHKYQLEKQLENYVPTLSDNDGFHSYRLLKSNRQNIYKVLLGFDSRNAYDDYKKSSAFRENLSLEATKPLAGASSVHASYLEKYFYPVDESIVNEDE
ncbi:signal transduction protein TRAP [Staphylococcus microti]|uniref:Signal transduction protein TRAP n=2 Tax=Staphylococcus microti TaxID=569857 RepID=A0A0D6XT61_9STAP|nr:antibiotic biosynthesis monooxygenase [Staphylococcus microti]KIX91401.1 signal transduction protein TRAP [Staphylococcus microti]SUM57836.1 signal transduction protein TRAP [Staphylococcus microti]